ncbi:MAG: repressor LexA [Bacteroidetes bacterium]|nr:repressor LexA [Bacteroidota bacterium]
MKGMGYKSPRSGAEIIEALIQNGVLKKKKDGALIFNDVAGEKITHAQTVDVPLLGLVACGLPILAEENIDAVIPVSVDIAKPPHRYFFLRAKGNSMNLKGIQDGDLVLIKQQQSANNGDVVVALIDNDATIKEFQRNSDMIILYPRSTEKEHQPIILTRDFQIQGIVITTISQL